MWLHGVGEADGTFWHRAFLPLDDVAGLRRLYPTAAARTLSAPALGGEPCAAWFDLASYPLTADEPEAWPEESPEACGEPRECTTALSESVARIHRLLDSLAEEGVATERIVLGGFSQGGALALAAGLCHRRRLAGLVCVSGWCTQRTQLASRVHAANARARILLCSGTSDPVVPFALAKRSAAALEAAMPTGRSVRFEKADRGRHPPTQREVLVVTQFIRECFGG